MKIAFLYGGQGSQVEKMSLNLYENYPYVKVFYDSLNMDFDLKDLSFNGNLEEISKTKYTQGILLAHQIAVTDILRENNIVPDITLGLSLGEYGALYGADILDRDEAMDLIAFRSREMAKIENHIDSAMAAVMTDDVEKIEKVLDSINTDDERVEISGINTKRQITISGEKDMVEKAIELLREERIRSIKLNTSGPFHTSYMAPVEEKLADYLKDVKFKKSNIKVYSNYTGEIENDNWEYLLSKQVSHTVRLKDALLDLVSKNYDLIIEIGYKETMKNFLNRLDKNVEVISLSDLDSIEKFLKDKGD